MRGLDVFSSTKARGAVDRDETLLRVNRNERLTFSSGQPQTDQRVM